MSLIEGSNFIRVQKYFICGLNYLKDLFFVLVLVFIQGVLAFSTYQYRVKNHFYYSLIMTQYFQIKLTISTFQNTSYLESMGFNSGYFSHRAPTQIIFFTYFRNLHEKWDFFRFGSIRKMKQNEKFQVAYLLKQYIVLY